LHILDSELRLITPTQPEGLETEQSPGAPSSHSTDRYYHLTHDYLVESLREWLTSKQKETRRGRAELLLAQRSADWALNPTNRSLPSFFEWSNILLFAPPGSRRSPRQHQALLKAAARYFGSRILIVTVVMSLLAWGAFQWNGATEAAKYVHSLGTARIADVPALIQKMKPYRRWADPRLRQMFNASAPDSPEKLRAALALLPVDESLSGELSTQLIQLEPDEFAVICDALQPISDRTPLIDWLWKEASDPGQDSSARFRAGLVLSRLMESGPMPEFVAWKRLAPMLTSQLVTATEVDPAHYDIWLRQLRPIQRELIPELAKVFRDSGRSTFQRDLSASVLSTFLNDGNSLLAELAVDATPTQISRILPKLRIKEPTVVGCLQEIVRVRPDGIVGEDERDRGAKRRANAAALLLQLENPEPVWNLLRFDADPRTATYLIARLADCRVEPALLLSRLQMEDDPAVRANLVLTLGSYPIDSIPSDVKPRLQQQMLQLCQEDSNCAVHSAAEWALRSWKMADKVALLQREAAKVGRREGFRWYVTPEGDTLAVITAPVDALLGSPATESGRDSDESLVRLRIERPFAIATTEITKAQYKRFRPNFRHPNEHSPDDDCPINAVTWFDAACYCRWLSEQEHIPEDQMCFPAISQIKPGMKLARDVLSHTGYRLPTEREWEYACRAGTETVRPYGHDPALLGKYAWYYSNGDDRSWPVGTVKPNGFGLFDMLGNVSEWCLDIYARDLASETDQALNRSAIWGQMRVVERGGGYNSNARTVRSANRKMNLPQQSSFSIGFRIARTLPSKPQRSR
jgi:formylglycine-generating enzyme required for sulfatase activity